MNRESEVAMERFGQSAEMESQRGGQDTDTRFGTSVETTGRTLASGSERLMSLDALRGFDMFWIVGGTSIARALLKDAEHPALVRLGEQLTHVEWEGFRFYDLIFPLFLFMIGVAIPLAMRKRLAEGVSKVTLYRQIAVRVAVLVVLGMMVNGNLLTLDPEKFQISYSVLQMLALGYAVAAVIYLNLALRWQIIATVSMLLGYWALLAFVPVPGHEVGVFQRGAMFGDWLNDAILGDWQGRWRSGWILGILGHASTAMLGVFAGQILQSPMAAPKQVATLVGLGVACLASGLLWSGWVAQWCPGLLGSWQTWPVWCPIIKPRWTSSYALYAGGWSFLLLAVFYQVIDVWRVQRWSVFFVVIGCNSIFAYMCWQLGRNVFRSAGEVMLGGLKQYLATTHYEALAWAGGFFVLWLLLWYLRRNRTFIRA